MMITEIMLNVRLVLNKPDVISMALSFTPFRSIMAVMKMVKIQRKNTINIRSIHGRFGKAIFIAVENTNVPMAANNAPLEVALL